MTSTYRLQLQPAFGFDAAAAAVPYLADLGVSHLYLSPVLQAAEGSTHGYDVVDHTRVSTDLGGAEAFERLAEAAHRRGMGLVVDVVPNHMCVPTPAVQNAKLWAVLRDGPASPYARWFDVDWTRHGESGHGALLMPVLGRRIGQCLTAGEIQLDALDGEPVLRYFDHVFPVRPGTEDLPLPVLVDQQFYRLAYWRVADDELNYRRFFDVDTLAAVRTEDPDVFAASHDLLVQLYADGKVDGFRIDHPDGLADPRGYLRWLAEATDHAWVVVEKILEREEHLPEDWVCAGTTGYDALWRIQGLFVDPAGADPLLTFWEDLTGEPRHLDAVALDAKRQMASDLLAAEVARVVERIAELGEREIRWRDFTRRKVTDALVEFLVAVDVYRAYVVPGEPPPVTSVATVEAALARAGEQVPDLVDELQLIGDLALGRIPDEIGKIPGLEETPEVRRLRAEICVRLQQTTGPVMAKGLEDTAYYRWYPLAALCEVGSPADRFGCSADDFHDWARERVERQPAALTALSTHDTKRSEDVRARLCVLSELPDDWRTAVTRWSEAASRYRPAALDRATEYLAWQTLVGAWPLDAERLGRYLEKASREAKVHTSWTSPDADYDSAVQEFVREVFADEAILGNVSEFVADLAVYEQAVVLGQKLVQLTCPGVPDLYQGSEHCLRTLVDPDNRGVVDFDAAAQRAAESSDCLDGEKQRLVVAALRLRAEHQEWFTGPEATYEPLAATSGHAVGFVRGGGAVTVVTARPAALHRHGGWGSSLAYLPEGTWRDVFHGRHHAGGPVPLTDLLADSPVALLGRID